MTLLIGYAHVHVHVCACVCVQMFDLGKWFLWLLSSVWQTKAAEPARVKARETERERKAINAASQAGNAQNMAKIQINWSSWMVNVQERVAGHRDYAAREFGRVLEKENVLYWSQKRFKQDL